MNIIRFYFGPRQTPVKNLRREAFLVENSDVMTERDNAEASKAAFDTEIQSEAFGFNNNLSME